MGMCAVLKAALVPSAPLWHTRERRRSTPGSGKISAGGTDAAESSLRVSAGGLHPSGQLQIHQPSCPGHPRQRHLCQPRTWLCPGDRLSRETVFNLCLFERYDYQAAGLFYPRRSWRHTRQVASGEAAVRSFGMAAHCVPKWGAPSHEQWQTKACLL